MMAHSDEANIICTQLIPQDRLTELSCIRQQDQITEISKYSAIEQLQEHLLTEAPKITKWKALHLKIRDIRTGNIVKALRNIIFDKLITLRLFDCFIETIQGLSWLRAPELEQINIWMNMVTSIVPLRKLNSQKLHKIIVVDNRINQIIPLININSDGITEICLQNWLGNFVQDQSISDFSKLRPIKDTVIFIQSSTRINQEKVMACLKKKYKPGQMLIKVKEDLW